MDRVYRLLPSVACIVVGVASFALSYVALRDVSAAIGAVPEYLAWLVPVVIDGGVICGSSVIWSQSVRSRRRQMFPFLFVASLVVVSVVVNTAHASDSLLAKGIAALPPLVLLGSIELVAAQHRRQVLSAVRDPDSVPDPSPAGSPARPGLHVETVVSSARGGDGASASSGAPLATAAGSVSANGASAGYAGNGHTSNGNGHATNGNGHAAPTSDAPPSPEERPSSGPYASEPDPARTARTGRPLRVSATPASTAQAVPALASPPQDASVKDAVAHLFDHYVASGGDPHDRKLAARIAAELDSSANYVTSLLRPLRKRVVVG